MFSTRIFTVSVLIRVMAISNAFSTTPGVPF
jgi:hypothetical protein